MCASCRLAFVKRRWVIGGQESVILIPWRRFEVSTLLSNKENTSVPKIIRKGDKGSHCSRPRMGKKTPNKEPLRIIDYLGVVVHYLVNRIYFLLNPRQFWTKRKKSHSILSKTFSISTLIAMLSHFSCFWQILWKILWAIMEFSLIILTKTKTSCRGDINLWRTVLSLLERIL